MLGGLLAVGMVFLTVAFAMAIGGTVLQEVHDDFANNTATSAWNTTFTAANSSKETAQLHAPLIEGSLTLYLSNSSNTEIPLTNFTVNYDAGTIGLKSELTPLNGSGFNANYQYSAHDKAWNTTEGGLNGLATYTKWMPTYALIVIAVIIITMVFGAFVFMTGGRR